MNKPIEAFLWNENFDTGIPQIDEQHKKLVNLLNMLASCLASQADHSIIINVFNELAEYAVYHFQTEENVWHHFLAGDIREVDHKKEHGSFMSEVLSLRKEENNKPLNEVFEDILSFLTYWLASHILESDKFLSRIVLAVQSGKSLEQAKQQANQEMIGAMKITSGMVLSMYSTLYSRTLKLLKETVARDQELLSMIENSPDIIARYDSECRRLYVNPAFGTLTDGGVDALLGRKPSEYPGGQNSEIYETNIKAVFATGKNSQFELKWLGKDGKEICSHIQLTAERDSSGTVVSVLGVGRDITELNDSRSSLNRANEELRFHSSILHNLTEGINLVRASDGVIVFTSHQFDHMLGYGPGELPGKHVSVLNAPGTKSPEAVAATILSQLERYGKWHGDVQFIKKNGDTFWCLTNITKFNHPEFGRVWMSLHEDITDRKRAEESLLITASVFGNCQEAILITDANNTILEVNPAFTRVTGYSREEMIGKNPKRLSSGLHGKDFFEKLWKSLHQEKFWRGEIWNRRKSGELYAELLSISSICDSEGKVQRYVAVFSDISQIKAHEAELNRVAHYDALTGIPNRVLLADRMNQAISQTAREKNMMAVCYIDLDGFKPINDTLGHEVGDEVLVEVAKRIEKTIRGGDTVARLGGDEFAVLLLGLAQGEECEATLERLLVAIAQPIIIDNTSCTTSASIGVCVYPLDDENPDILLRYADQAMYVAKKSGKNRYHIYNQISKASR